MIDVGSVVRTKKGKLTATVRQVLYNMVVLDRKLEGAHYWSLDLLEEVAGPESCPDVDKETA
jgi:hypothetical protein